MEQEEDDAAMILLHQRNQETSLSWVISRWPDAGEGSVTFEESSCWYLLCDQKWILQTTIHQ